MTEIYCEEDYSKAKKERKVILAVYFTVLALLIGAMIAVLLVYIFQPYNTPLKVPLIIAEVGISAILIIFSFIFMGIKNKRMKAYYKMLKALKTGLKETTVCIYDSVGESEEKDGCDFNVLVFYTWFEKKGQYFKRNVLVDKEKPLPEFEEGDIVKFVTQGNVLIMYEKIGHDDNFVNFNKEVDIQ